VHEGSVLNVATLDAEPGSQVELRDVLLMADGNNVTLGDPLIADAVVIAEVIQHGKGRKVVNFKYKAKVRYRRKRGHRQAFTRLSVKSISIGAPAAAATTSTRRRRAEPAAATAEAPVAEAPAEEAPQAEAAAPRRRRRAGTEETQTQE
jgi:large subunit ribosomal protein L21